MKKIISLFLCIAILISLVCITSSCAKSKDDGNINVICTIFPYYDWAKNVIGASENVTLSLIISNGADPHSYQPTATDILNISNCDVIIYTGGSSDVWVEAALEKANSPDIRKIKLIELDGMTLHNVSASDHEHDHEHDHGEFDEHIWLSLKNARLATQNIADELSAIDVKNAERYTENAKSYAQELLSLDESFVNTLAEEHPFMLFADRFPFVYTLSDYGISYQAAFEGCTTDASADFDTIISLIEEAKLHNTKYVCVTESSDKALAKTVISSSNHTEMEILTFNSIQGITKRDIESGVTYLSLMKNNLETMKKAIS